MNRLLSVAFLAAALAGASVWAQDPAKYSGFLSDYSKLTRAPDREGVLLYIDKSKDYKPYTKVMFDPVEVVLVPNPDYKGVQPDVLKKMTDNFLASFKRALDPGYQVVGAPGPDVLRVRAAITGVQPASTPLTPLDFLPIKAVFNVGRAAVGEAPHVAEMTAEIEVLDPSGNRVAAAAATRKGDKTLKQGEQITWTDLQAITDYWAKGFRQRLDELRGVAAK